MRNFNKRVKALILSTLVVLGLFFTVVPLGPEYPDPVPMSVETEVGIDLSESN